MCVKKKRSNHRFKCKNEKPSALPFILTFYLTSYVSITFNQTADFNTLDKESDNGLGWKGP